MLLRLFVFIPLMALFDGPHRGQSSCWVNPEPCRMVYDEADLLDYASEARLQVAVEQFNRYYDVVLVVYLASELCGWSALGFATVLGSDWGLGDSELQNGLVRLLSPKYEGQQGGVALSFGKGLEARITEAESQSIIEDMIPFLKEGNGQGAFAFLLNKGLPLAIQN